MSSANRPRLFSRGEWPEAERVAALLRQETVGGALLLLATVLALLWSNSPWRDGYTALADHHLDIAPLGIHLSVAHWAADGLLAVFFFVVGLELKHEFVHGDLRDPAKATVPVVAAACGVAVPAIVFTVAQLLLDGDLRGWAVPTATDIAFALAVLAVIGTHLPSALRSFLLTLAVVDDLIAITIIAVFFSSDLDLPMLALAVLPVAAFGWVSRTRSHPWWLLLPLGVATWVLVLNSGVHATIAGVVLGLVVPASRAPGGHSLGERLEHRIRPLSAGFCVPVFAFFAAGVSFVGGDLAKAFTDPITIGVVAGLVLGKLVGIFGSTFLMARFTRAELDDDIAWSDLFGLSLLAGVGFTVSLLIGELAFGAGSIADEHVKIGVLIGSLIAALLATIVLRSRNKIYARIHDDETRDDDLDGIPDVYQRGPGRGGAATTDGNRTLG
ncbi:Na+/H+ antiporter NhaA [Calidifontibacter indicus]|uniref:Na(+)/H(+) antiporter NhaA n=1 Tax=Calidifontibacter indicus TaxID=419650 RepID=A0A3D9UVD2_9MICO|nr:Na+/H+ antiporter NhaA [Calidifontibacter indicus]REF29954.1 sodium/proton antiporter (NhaA family) [Calidifontibacter indicus]